MKTRQDVGWVVAISLGGFLAVFRPTPSSAEQAPPYTSQSESNDPDGGRPDERRSDQRRAEERAADERRADERRAMDATRPIEIGLFGGALFMSGEHELYSGVISDHRAFRPAALELGVRAAYLPFRHLGVEAEGWMAPTDTKSGRSALLWGLRGHLIGQVPFDRIVPMVVVGGGVMGVSSKAKEAVGSDRDPEVHWGLGVKYFASDTVALRFDARHIIGPAHDLVPDRDTLTSHFELLVGATVVFGGAEDGEVPDDRDRCSDSASPPPQTCPPLDRDRDGIADDVDRCPDESGPAPEGCPARDADGDGVVDSVDACPDEAGVAPDGCPARDTDGDGVVDSADSCPRESEDIDGFEDKDGCPDLDNDRDGVVDSSDRCPAEVGPVENRGCPDADTDGDGVVDRLDNCPLEAGTQANYGCGTPQLVAIHRERIEILDKIYFETGRAEIQRRSFTLLDNVASVIIAHPEIMKIRVEGHTDSVGPEATNLRLSQKRADAVRIYLVEKGVAGDRLEAVGYGESQPVSTNRTSAGRATNRRVELTILDDSAPPRSADFPE